MFGFIRRAFRPIASIGQKIGSIFKIGSKGEIIKDLRNTMPFEEIVGGLRNRVPNTEVMGMGGEFYGDMNSMLKGYKYPPN
jgi:hypothetical protein